jgi:hypothetical protein
MITVTVTLQKEIAPMKAARILPSSDICQPAADTVTRSTTSGTTIFTTVSASCTAVTINTKTSKQAKFKILHLLARGEKEIGAGFGFEMDAVFTEADSMLAKLCQSALLANEWPIAADKDVV